jgi:multidrug efflux pump subunit AcrB
MSRFFGQKKAGDGRRRRDRVEGAGHGEYKEFWLTSFAVDHPTSVLVLMISIILAGFVSYIRVPKEAAPEITVPFISVNTIYPGVAPEDIETLITREIELELNKIGDVKEITSNSVEGYSSVVVEFEAGMDMTEALQQVREKVDIAKPELPLAAEEPMIIEFNFAEFPIMQVNISGEYSLVRLKQLAEDVQDRIEQIPNVLEVTLSGGLEREVQINVDLPKLKYYGRAFQDVIDAIWEENVTTPGGSIDVGDMKYLVRVPGQFENTRLIEDIVITTPGDRPVYIRDVATVDFGFKERDSYARLDGQAVVTLSVSKRVGKNIIQTADAVRAAVEEMTPSFPPTTTVKITSDVSEDVHHMVSSLENNIISGLIFVVAVLLFALGIRTASFVGVAIPLSMLLSFSVIQLSGMTMNFIVLFSLILALGMLVDNAIVIVENIYRFRENGYDNKEAAKLAAGEVAMPVMAATATTLAAFAPLAFWPGIVGEFMGYLPKTLIITLSSSLFVALVINPVLCSLFLRPEGERGPGLTKEMKWAFASVAVLTFVIVALIRPLPAILLAATVALLWAAHHYILAPAALWIQEVSLPATLRWYERALRLALAHRFSVMVGAGLSLVGAVMLFGMFSKGVVFFPEDIPPSTIYVQVEAPTGTRVDVTNDIVRRIEEELDELAGREDVESVVSTIGGTASDFGTSAGTHLATVAVTFVDYEYRQHDTFETLELMRSTIGRDIAGATIVVEKPQDGPPTGLPITIEIVGEDAQLLKQLGDRIVTTLENSSIAPKLEGLESDMADARPELTVNVDRERAQLFGLNTSKVGFTVRSAINGVEAGEYRDGKDEYDIVVRLAEEYRQDLSSVSDLTIVAEDGSQVPLLSVASWDVNESFSGINRKDLDRVVTVSSDVRSGYNANAVLAEVQAEIADFAASLPTGYDLRYAGQQQEQQESATFLIGAFMTAMLLIAFILVSQFDSVLRPVIILSSIILSTVGVLIGLTIFQMPFGIIMSGVGVISLGGIVVNNAIVLIDYIHILRERDGMSNIESLVRGGLTRFRPVTLTAITTVVGLIPLAIGMNIDFYGFFGRLQPNFYWGGEQAAWWGPMAIAVICGLTFATFLTLILVPVMHSYTDDIAAFFERHFTHLRDDEKLEEAVEGADIEVREAVTA